MKQERTWLDKKLKNPALRALFEEAKRDVETVERALADVARLRRKNARLRGWLRYMESERAAIVYRETMPSTRLALLCQAALRGDAPPKRRAK